MKPGGSAESRRPVLFLFAVLTLWFNLGATRAQGSACYLLCSPALKFEPTATIENIFRSTTVAILDGGVPVEVQKSSVGTQFETVLALDVPTEVPWLGLTFEAIVAPFKKSETNVFTGGTAVELGTRRIRDNPVELEFEANFHWLEPSRTGNWVGSHFDLVDQFSPSERPRDQGTYTHKFDLELDTSFAVFQRLPKDNWLRNVELEVSLDYLATGIPRKGDQFGGREVFLNGASPWSFSILLVIPIAPLRP